MNWTFYPRKVSIEVNFFGVLRLFIYPFVSFCLFENLLIGFTILANFKKNHQDSEKHKFNSMSVRVA